jgi:Tfp pilus assembly protein PilF
MHQGSALWHRTGSPFAQDEMTATRCNSVRLKRNASLDDSLSEAHSSLAFVDFYWSWDVTGAQREFGHAVALDPNSVIAHHWYATFLLHLGRFPESLEEIEKAQKLDPNSTAILADKGLIWTTCKVLR